jgi:signal transduction histidine kinase
VASPCVQMSRWLTSISAFGGVLIAFALGRAAFGLASGGFAPGTAVDFALLSAPGFVLWYVAQWLPDTEFDPSLYPRVLAWSVGGVGVMLAFSLLRVVHPGVTVDGSLGTQAIAVAIGSFGGLAIGIREAEAKTRARELADRNQELAERERELERQNDRLDEFTSIVSHDLRNPLNVAAGHLELAGKADGDAAGEHLSAVADAHDRMESMIEDLLSLARQGETVDDLEPVDVGDLAANRWEGVAGPDATLDAPADCVVRADEQRLGQVFSNLLRNAVEHGSTGNRTAEQSDDAVEHGGAGVAVTVGALDDGEGFYVEDDGPGIPPDERDQVFDHGYTNSTDGTGVGLAVVGRVSEAHGWTVSLTDGESGGARFEFRGVEFVASSDDSVEGQPTPGRR